MENQFIKDGIKDGETIILNNAQWCEDNQSDDFRQMELSKRDEPTHTWANGFKIEFNGKAFSFKTFPAFRKKIDQLINDLNLELATEEANF